MFHKAIDLKFLDGTALAVTFQDGKVKLYDMRCLFSKYPQLKALEEHGLVRRVQYEAIPPRVEYRLTDMGEKFRPVIAAMEAGGNTYIDYLGKKAEP